MTISKITVKEVLSLYLSDKGLKYDNCEKIVGSLFSDVDKKLKMQKDNEKKEIERERKREKARVSHGTSCPRISNSMGELITEF